MIAKEIIKNNFSRCAGYYDSYSNIQNLCASELIDKINMREFETILEIGCGTGNYTSLLREKFPRARITALDISREMINIARLKLNGKKINFALGDGEKADFKEKFDLITSNAVFQWFGDLEKSLAGYKHLLSEKGVVRFSMFGPATFCELDYCLKLVISGNASIVAGFFKKQEDVKKILNRLFADSSVEPRIYKEDCVSLLRLLKKIKYTGVRGSRMFKKNIWTADALAKIGAAYKQKYSGITATYEVFFCKGEK